VTAEAGAAATAAAFFAFAGWAPGPALPPEKILEDERGKSGSGFRSSVRLEAVELETVECHILDRLGLSQKPPDFSQDPASRIDEISDPRMAAAAW